MSCCVWCGNGIVCLRMLRRGEGWERRHVLFFCDRFSDVIAVCGDHVRQSEPALDPSCVSLRQQ